MKTLLKGIKQKNKFLKPNVVALKITIVFCVGTFFPDLMIRSIKKTLF